MDEYDAGNPSHVDKRKSKRRREEERVQEAIRFVLSDYKGREFLWELLSKCGIFKVSYDGTDYTIFKEGRRSVGLDMLVDIEQVNPHAFAKIRDEAVERNERNK